MTTCIIAEKPSVARDLARIVGAIKNEEGYLSGNNYLVTWAIGHLITLAMPEFYGLSVYKAEELPIRPTPFRLVVRQIRKGKEWHDDPAALKQLKAIRHCFSVADRIVVATDAGREGELIFRYIYHYIGCTKPFERLWISSLTDKAIRKGLGHLKQGSDYDVLYHSAKCRSEADWLVGINASRALSIARQGGYSLGRVQTPTLAMVCRRYREHRGFTSVPYWRLSATLEQEGITLRVQGEMEYGSREEAETSLEVLRTQGILEVLSSSKKVGQTAPPLLYDLTTLQKDANRRFGYSADRTLSIAQSLYEKKVTTYPRTGSRYISEDVFNELPARLVSMGAQLPSSSLSRHSVDDNKVTDHHAIIPTGEAVHGLSNEENIVYNMIVLRTLEALSPNSEEERMQVVFSDGMHRYQWRGIRSIYLGWKGVRPGQEEGEEANEEADAELPLLPSLKVGDRLPMHSATASEHQTKPKPLYTEATLLSAMEHAGKEGSDIDSHRAIAACGIGTPATRASIIETLILRGYIRREKKTLVPTEKGLVVYELVKDMQIANAEMTGSWELALSGIEARKVSPEHFMERITSYTEQITRELLASHAEHKLYPTYRCPKCGGSTLGIYAKIAKCSDEGCRFVLFREICGTTLSEDIIHDLITAGRTPMLKGLISKTGKKFNACLVLKGDHTTTFEFEQKKGE